MNPRVAGVVARSSASQAEHGPEPVDLWWPRTIQIGGPQGHIRVTFFMDKSTDVENIESYRFLAEYCQMVIGWLEKDAAAPTIKVDSPPPQRVTSTQYQTSAGDAKYCPHGFDTRLECGACLRDRITAASSQSQEKP